MLESDQKGIGDPIGSITLEDSTTVDAGGVMSRGSWNAWLHGRLADAYEQSKQTEKPDVHFYKNRSSGVCDKMTACTEYLETNNLRTLLFTGLNTDQCVMGTLQDAYSKGFDTIMLGDGCATNSPEYAQLSCEFNCMRSWGFLSSCKDLAEAAEQIPK
ncbi:hypothetical protein F4825DRAFT_456975 [Nemania diffusa]|nr:hypothetical protein F4825DRAFT_456975 [Nemania diffusa]